MKVTQETILSTVIIKVSDDNYSADIVVNGGSLLPFDSVTASNGKESLHVMLTSGKYGYFLDINDATYFVKFRDFDVTTDKIIEMAKKGYDTLKEYIMSIVKKGKVVKRRW